MPHIPYSLVETAPPGAEPLTLDETKTFLRVDHDNDDAQISALIAAARQMCENLTGRSLITRSYSLYLDCWPGGNLIWWDGIREGADISPRSALLNLPKPPLVSVTGINVYAADNTATAFPAADYYVDTAGLPGRIVLKPDVSPPVPGRPANGIEIQFRAGYGATPQSIPAALRQAMKQLVAYLYEHRGDGPDQALLASGAAHLLHPFKLVSLS